MDKKIGILGSGQLGRMLAQAAGRLGIGCKFLPFGDTSACEGLGEIVEGDWKDESVRGSFLSDLQLVTYEWENVPVELVVQLEKSGEVYPSSKVLSATQDRLEEKQFLQSLGIAVPRFLALSRDEDLELLESQVGFPCIFKTRRFGYDGKGQARVKNSSEARETFYALGGSGVVAEEFVLFTRELSIIAVCESKGISCYPLVENIHHDGILRLSLAPAKNVTSEKQHAAVEMARKIAGALDYRGVFCLELFDTQQGLFANEIAPRVHNSGHWSLDGAEVSQFENHIRAVCGLSGVSTSISKESAMINLIGEIPRSAVMNELSKCTGVFLHDYQKRGMPGRKVGHLNVVCELDSSRDELLNRFRAELPELFPQEMSSCSSSDSIES